MTNYYKYRITGRSKEGKRVQATVIAECRNLAEVYLYATDPTMQPETAKVQCLGRTMKTSWLEGI